MPRSIKGEPASCQGHLTGPLDTYSVNIYKHMQSKVILIFYFFFIGKKAEQEIKLVQLKKLIEFFIVSEVISI